MLYSSLVTIPHNTTPAAPLRFRMKVADGVVRKVWVVWRWGSGNLCGARINYEEVQVWPSSPGEWLTSIPHEIEFEEDYVIRGVPRFFHVYAYNVDDTFDHDLWVAFSVLRPSISSRLEDFMRWMGKDTNRA